MRNSPWGGRGVTVRPASEVTTVNPVRPASASASTRASPVPPKISKRLEPGTPDEASLAIDDDDLDRGLSVEQSQGLLPGTCGDEVAQRQSFGLREAEYFHRGIRLTRRI